MKSWTSWRDFFNNIFKPFPAPPAFPGYKQGTSGWPTEIEPNLNTRGDRRDPLTPEPTLYTLIFSAFDEVTARSNRRGLLSWQYTINTPDDIPPQKRTIFPPTLCITPLWSCGHFTTIATFSYLIFGSGVMNLWHSAKWWSGVTLQINNTGASTPVLCFSFRFRLFSAKLFKFKSFPFK